MQIVINISEDLYEDIIAHDRENREGAKSAYYFEGLIQNGTPLPKGHKVIDAYALQEHLALVAMEDRTYREAVEIIDWFPSIIEADRSEEE